jgi:hypothetical protein
MRHEGVIKEQVVYLSSVKKKEKMLLPARFLFRFKKFTASLQEVGLEICDKNYNCILKKRGWTIQF